MSKLMIIHFQPIELYPPVMNLINFLAQRSDLKAEILVYSMKDESSLNQFTSDSPFIRIIRGGILHKKQSALYNLLRYAGYIKFYTAVLLQLQRFKPAVVLYFDTLSSFPALLYKTYINKRSSIMAHYHEYTSLQEYENGMQLNKWFHSLEIKLYKQFFWVSHTNADRMRKFIADHPGADIPGTYILPNYPPLSWKNTNTHINGATEPIKIIYAGALGMETMYTKNFADWVIQQGNKVMWHIYSTNITPDALTYITSLHAVNIEFKGGTGYDNLPVIMKKYDVGVILYNGHIPNYVYNAPNKLFEYLACGLDVLFPEVMKGCLPYVTKGTYPKITGLNFNSLLNEDIEKLVDKADLVYEPSRYYSENVLTFLLDKIKFGIHGTLQDC